MQWHPKNGTKEINRKQKAHFLSETEDEECDSVGGGVAEWLRRSVSNHAKSICVGSNSSRRSH